jgi:hypothetical protein
LYWCHFLNKSDFAFAKDKLSGLKFKKVAIGSSPLATRYSIAYFLSAGDQSDALLKC